MGTGDFTIEFFALFLDTGAGGFVTVEATNGMAFYYTGSYFTLSKRGASHTEYVKYTHTPTLNTWHHIAVCRSGTGSNETALFFNGSRVAQSTNSEDYTVQAALNIGNIPVANYGFNGHLSNVRIVKGSSVYDTSSSSITVPTAPLTAVTNTKLLTCQSNRFIDNSTSNHTIIVSGSSQTPRIQPFSPFKPTRSYSKDAIGGSVYFDNTGDYIFADGGSTAGSSFKVPTGEQFSTEFWLYKTGATNNVDVPISAEVLDEFQFAINADAKLSLNFFGSTITYSPTFPLASNPIYHHAWNHFVVTRDSSDNKIRTFINGNLVSITGAITTDITFQDLVIGCQGKGTDHCVQGFLASVRHNVGDIPSAYTTTETSTGTQVFTAPTAPVTADNNTVLLLNFNNAGIIDHTMKNNLNTVGNVRIRTDVKKLGTGSIYFDGGDSIRWRQTSDISTGMAIGTGPFTIEFFVYFDGDPNNGGTNGQASLIRDAGGSLVIQRYDGEWEAGNESTPQIQVAQSLSNQTWYHVAMTRDSSANLKLFINGTQAGSTATSHTTNFSKNEWHIGALNADASGGRALTGYMDEIRIIAGVALYTSNFTAPTEPFANR